MKKLSLFLLLLASFCCQGQHGLNAELMLNRSTQLIDTTSILTRPIFIKKGEELKVKAKFDSVLLSLKEYDLLIEKGIINKSDNQIQIEKTLSLSRELLTKVSLTTIQIEQSSEKMMKKAWHMNLLEGSVSVGLGVLVGYLIWNR